jgi:hypothetical protein
MPESGSTGAVAAASAAAAPAGLLRFALGALALCTLATAVAWKSGPALVSALVPPARWSMHQMEAGLAATALSVEQGRSEQVIRMRSRVVSPLVVGTQVVFPTGEDWFDIATPLFGMLVPFVLAAGLAGAWPGSLALRLARTALGGVLAVAWLMVDLPMSLLGFAWGALRDSHAPGVWYPSILWLEFMHAGGRLAVGVLLAAVACLLLRPRGTGAPEAA